MLQALTGNGKQRWSEGRIADLERKFGQKALQRYPLDGTPQIHVPLPLRMALRVEAVEAGATHAAQLHNAPDRQLLPSRRNSTSGPPA